MPSTKHIVMLLLTPLLLSACGEGWEKKLTNTHFPYGNERTAGSGVMYVRAKMMPEQTLKVEPPKMEEKAVTEEVKEEENDLLRHLERDAEHMFKAHQKK